MPMSDLNNEGLVVAYAQAMTEATSAKRRAAYERLLQSRLLVLAQPPAEGGEDASMVILTGEDGQRALPTFTDAEAVREFAPDGGPVGENAAVAIFQAALEEDLDVVVINPGQMEWELKRGQI